MRNASDTNANLLARIEVEPEHVEEAYRLLTGAFGLPGNPLNGVTWFAPTRRSTSFRVLASATDNHGRRIDLEEKITAVLGGTQFLSKPLRTDQVEILPAKSLTGADALLPPIHTGLTRSAAEQTVKVSLSARVAQLFSRLPRLGLA
jgi:hypothetical protein